MVRLSFGKGGWYDNAREKIKRGACEDCPLFPVAFVVLGRGLIFPVGSLFTRVCWFSYCKILEVVSTETGYEDERGRIAIGRGFIKKYG